MAAAVAGRPLALLAPRDAMMNTVDVGMARATYRWTETAYHAAGASGRFRLAGPCGDGNRVDRYLELLS